MEEKLVLGSSGVGAAEPLAGGFPGARIRARRPPAHLLALALAVGLAGAVFLIIHREAHPVVAHPLKPAARAGLASLPLAAQGPISELLGRGSPTYRVRGLHAVNPAQRLRLAFSRNGVSVASGSAKLGIALSAYGYGDKLRPVGTVAPRGAVNRVLYARGALSEWYANGPLGLEQGFTVASRPSLGTGPLELSLSLTGGLAARLQRGSVLLEGHGAKLRYGALSVTDAHGHRLRSSLALASGQIVIRVNDRGAAYPLRIDPLVQQAELKPSGGERGFFTAVATSGTTVAVGNPGLEGSEGTKYNEGAVYIFHEPSSGWANATETAKLTSPGKAASENEQFGHGVAIAGDTLVVGAPGYGSVGAVFVFQTPAEEWASVKQVAVLSASDAHQNDGFGWSVALSGNTIAVGAPGHSPSAHTITAGGAAYVFVEPGGGWVSTSAYSAELNAGQNEVPCQEVGVSVATTESTVVVGAPAVLSALGVEGFGECKPHSLSGHTFVFVKPESWPGPGSAALGPVGSLTPSGAEVDDLFGTSVAISASGNTILAGSPGQKANGTTRVGAAYAFTKPSGGWSEPPEQSALSSPKGVKGVEFGNSVAISGDGATAVVAQPNNSEPSPENNSAGFVFSLPGGSSPARVTGELANPMNGIVSVALAGNTVIGAGYGAAFVFEPLAISVTSPGNGATYKQGQTVLASFTCSAPAGQTVTSCTGTVPDGAPIDTSSAGIHGFAVEATDSSGGKASTIVLYRVASPASETSPPSEATSKTATTPTKPELTPAEKAAAAAAAEARLEKEFAAFLVYFQEILNSPEHATIGAKLINEGGIPVSYKLVPEPALIATTGSTVTWTKPTGSSSRVSSVHAKPSLIFKLSYRVTKVGKVSFKIPLTPAGRKLLKKDLKTHRSLVIYWTVSFTPQAHRPVTKKFKVTFKPERRKKHH